MKKTTSKKATGTKKKPVTKKKATPKKAAKPLVEPSFRRPNDPKQEKILTKIQGFLRRAGSRSSVLPYLGILTEIERLQKVEKGLLQEAKDIRDAITMAEKSPYYQKLAKAKADEPLPAKDAFKFT